MTDDPVWLTRTEAAARAGRDVRTVDRWLASGALTRYRQGRSVRVDQAELDQRTTPQKERTQNG